MEVDLCFIYALLEYVMCYYFYIFVCPSVDLLIKLINIHFLWTWYFCLGYHFSNRVLITLCSWHLRDEKNNSVFLLSDTQDSSRLFISNFRESGACGLQYVVCLQCSSFSISLFRYLFVSSLFNCWMMRFCDAVLSFSF